MEVFLSFLLWWYSKIVKTNFNNVSDFFQANFIEFFDENIMETSTFFEQLKMLIVKPLFKHDPELKRKTIDQSVFFPIHLKFMNAFLLSN